ncbi:unnamed protein product [Linum tenue]|uniref:Uncharacterized protein n=1 Tax=Linum tenue TaxID=586396 RepID=A0AAV0NMV3_9ROSI|nr:unnamed protein product [Linum tenue]
MGKSSPWIQRSAGGFCSSSLAGTSAMELSRGTLFLARGAAQVTTIAAPELRPILTPVVAAPLPGAEAKKVKKKMELSFFLTLVCNFFLFSYFWGFSTFLLFFRFDCHT